MSKTIAANYEYWQQLGSEWPNEYDRRKKTQIYYHIQELMLADYMLHSSPARVLEYGCGFGRHLEYLRQIPGLEVYGVDQSPTMIAGFYQWAERDWIRDHVILGEPIGHLPYPDHYFDIVYTAEVLLHVRPEDIPVILSELLRVAQWQVFHLEPPQDYQLVGSEHHGCWYHDLAEEYARLGYTCETLTRGFQAQAPYRVVLAWTRPVYSSNEILATKFHRMELDIQKTLDAETVHTEELMQQITHDNQNTKTLAAELEQQERRAADLHSAAMRLQDDLESERAIIASLRAELESAQKRETSFMVFLKNLKLALSKV